MPRKRWTVDRATVCVAIGEMGPLPKKDRETVEDAKRFLRAHYETVARANATLARSARLQRRKGDRHGA